MPRGKCSRKERGIGRNKSLKISCPDTSQQAISPEVKSDVSDRGEGKRGKGGVRVREVVPHTRAGTSLPIDM